QGAQETSYNYTWHAGTAQMQSQTMTLPLVATTQNGPGTLETQITYFDVYGRAIWHQDGAGFLHYQAFDPATGAVVKAIIDVDTSKTTDFQDKPNGWMTPTGGGLHLITTVRVDALGRTTKYTPPNGQVIYSVYKDTNHEVRIYPGWDSLSGMPTGPTQVFREDRGYTPSYTEALTMTVAPHLDLQTGEPDGGEMIQEVQTLSRTFT